MAKRKKQKNNQIFKLASLVLLVLSIVLWFVVAPLETKETITLLKKISYLQASFGHTLKVADVEVLKFSFMNLVPLLLMVVGAIALLISIAFPKNKKDNEINIGVMVSTALSIILLFLVKSFVNVEMNLIDLDKFKIVFDGYVVPILLIGSLTFQYMSRK